MMVDLTFEPAMRMTALTRRSMAVAVILGALLAAPATSDAQTDRAAKVTRFLLVPTAVTLDVRVTGGDQTRDAEDAQAIAERALAYLHSKDPQFKPAFNIALFPLACEVEGFGGHSNQFDDLDPYRRDLHVLIQVKRSTRAHERPLIKVHFCRERVTHVLLLPEDDNFYRSHKKNYFDVKECIYESDSRFKEYAFCSTEFSLRRIFFGMTHNDVMNAE